MSQPEPPQLDYLQSDTALYPIIRQLGPIPLRRYKNPFSYLIRTVAGQQLSTKAAASIFEKFLQLVPKPTPEAVLLLTTDDMRKAGFSYRKATYLHNIAQFWIEHKITPQTFEHLEDEAVIELLTRIKGVGRWSVEIVLAFSLGRPDVFFADDLGIQQGMSLIYGWNKADKKELRRLMLEKACSYAPHSTAVCLYIWEWKNLVRSGLATLPAVARQP